MHDDDDSPCLPGPRNHRRRDHPPGSRQARTEVHQILDILDEDVPRTLRGPTCAARKMAAMQQRHREDQQREMRVADYTRQRAMSTPASSSPGGSRSRGDRVAIRELYFTANPAARAPGQRLAAGRRDPPRGARGHRDERPVGPPVTNRCPAADAAFEAWAYADDDTDEVEVIVAAVLAAT